MAETVGDSIVADETFQRIGDNVATLIWDDRRFQQVKEWVADVAPMAKLNRDGLKYGSENMKTAVGQQFLAEFQRLTAPAWSGCIAGLKNKSVRPFQVKLRLAEDGTVSGSGTFDSEDMPVIQCLFQTLNSKKPFATKPPKGDYWLLFDVDPAHPVSTAAPVATQAAK